ncbi:MAG TPA: hypothetical protein VFK94_02335 [Patescibacteria group bacterium]|nr:hypothetical protein [Patescibacteria group bacterium]
MANAEIENNLGITDKRRTQGATTTPVATDANYADVAALKARLTAAAPASYPAATLNLMTKNDMVYALRLIDDAAGI